MARAIKYRFGKEAFTSQDAVMKPVGDTVDVSNLGELKGGVASAGFPLHRRPRRDANLRKLLSVMMRFWGPNMADANAPVARLLLKQPGAGVLDEARMRLRRTKGCA